MTQKANNLAAYIWSLADLLRGDFKQSQYGRIILPFTLLRRLEGVLEKSKAKVLAEYEAVKKKKLPEEGEAKLLLRATGGLSFYNVSEMDLTRLGEAGIKDNLEFYIQGYSRDAREIFEYFNFGEFIGQLNDANLLYKVVQKVRQTDLSPKAISNHDMGKVFEELIRRFAESSNDTAGEHFTPRDIVHLTTSLVFMEDDDALTKPGIIRTIYDPIRAKTRAAPLSWISLMSPKTFWLRSSPSFKRWHWRMCPIRIWCLICLTSCVRRASFYGRRLSSFAWHSSRRVRVMQPSPISVNLRSSGGRSDTNQRLRHTSRPRTCLIVPRPRLMRS